jgi:lipopolysaccharide/colanic/teichoic acid biosynthesis glycosyltransferase
MAYAVRHTAGPAAGPADGLRGQAWRAAEVAGAAGALVVLLPLLAVIAAAILLNVVAGHMSLVGPRPLVPGEDALVAARWAARHDHRPGLTGLWQLHRSPQTTVDELIRLDQRYLAQRSAWNDLHLMASTGRSLFGRAGR